MWKNIVQRRAPPTKFAINKMGRQIFIIILSFALLHLRESLASTGLNFVDRDMWQAKAPLGPLGDLHHPVSKVIVAHTVTEECFNIPSCALIVRDIQDLHIEQRGFFDIGYNFLVGGDGMVFEGRGWNKVGAHTKYHNKDSVGIAFIGNFMTKNSTEGQLHAVQLLLKEGIANGTLTSEYKMFGHRQLADTKSPGDVLYDTLKTWSEWSPNVI